MVVPVAAAALAAPGPTALVFAAAAASLPVMALLPLAALAPLLLATPTALFPVGADDSRSERYDALI